jgi:hypothetical protein
MIRRKLFETAVALTQEDCQEVARVAYELWEQRGRTHGGDQLDWYQAEQIVRERKAQAPNRTDRGRTARAFATRF